MWPGARKPGRFGSIADMDLLAAKVWTYWLSIFIIVPIVLLVIGIGIAYLVKVVSLKYPRQ